jgi:hypothetical protein
VPDKQSRDGRLMHAKLSRQIFDRRSTEVSLDQPCDCLGVEPVLTLAREHRGLASLANNCSRPDIAQSVWLLIPVRIEALELHFSKGEVFLFEPEHIKTAPLWQVVWLFPQRGCVVVLAPGRPLLGGCLRQPWTRLRAAGCAAAATADPVVVGAGGDWTYLSNSSGTA